MTAITWTGAGGDDNFNNPANWSPAQVPGAGDSVTISTAAATAINLDNGLAVGMLTTNKFVTLDLSNQSTFTLGSGSAGTFANSGTLALNSTNQNTDLIIGSSRESLTAGGTIVLSSNGGNRIYGAAAGDVLVNVNNTIEGGGQLGNGTLTLNNAGNGKIIANAGTALVLNTGSAVITNSGLLEATTGSGGLIIQSVVSDGLAGQVSAAGGNVYLQGGDLRGGTLSSSGGAAITVQGGNSGTLDGTANTVTNTGTVAVNNQGTLTLLGAITDGPNGTIALQSSNQNTDLVIGPTTGTAGTVTLGGLGTLSLSDNGGNRIYGGQAGDTLLNESTIAGAGQLGNGTLTLINQGVIDATGGNGLVVNTGSTVINKSQMEATNPSGGLVLEATISNATGTLLANGANVYLQGADILGGLLNSTGAGAITVQGNQTGTLDGTANTVTNTGTVAVNNSGTLSVLGTIANAGLIALQSGNQYTDLIVGPATGPAGTVTLTGAGTLSLSDNPSNRIYGGQASDTLVNANNLIEGSGALGYGTLTLVNNATIDATGGNALVVNTGSTVVNNALMEATNAGGGGLVLQATVNDSSGGTLLAAGGNIYLQGADIVGGLLKSSGGGAITVQGNQTGTLDGSAHTVTNIGTVAINNSGTLSLLGTLVNQGVIALQSGNQYTDLIVSSPTLTLTGGGTVSLSDNGANRIYGTATTSTLDNVNNLIEGSGQIGAGDLTVINSGTIAATGSSNVLIFNSDAYITNTALIEATGSAGLVFNTTTVNDSSGGTLDAVGSNVFLQSTTVSGGLLASSAAQAIEIQGGYGATLDGSSSAVTNADTVQIDDSGTLSVLGTLVNDGTIALNSSNQYTDLIIASPTLTLTGGGTVALSNNPANRIYGSVAADTLDNVNNTIAGAGEIGDAQLTLINAKAGIIDANQSNTLTLSTGGSSVANAGLLESTGSGGLLILDTDVATSATGTVYANGGNVVLNGGTLTGGLLNTNNGGVFLVAGGTTGVLDGSSSAVTLAGSFDINNSGTLSVLGNIVNESGIFLQSGNQNTDLIIGPASGTVGTVTLSGSGSLVLSDNPANRIYGVVTGDTLINANNTIEGAGQLGAGQLTLVNDSLIDATGGNTLILNTGSTVTNNALIEAVGSGGLDVQSRVNSAGGGTILAAGGFVYIEGGVLAGGALNSSGGAAINVQANYTGGLDGTAQTVTNLGSVSISNQGTLDILGTITNDATISLLSSNQNTDLIADSASVTLTGKGTITLSDNGGNRIYGATGSDVLDNLNNLIEGAGQLGAGQLTLQNHGTIAATGGNSLVLNTGSTVVNDALMEAEGTGGLVIQAKVNDSAGGTLLTAGGNIYLQGADIIGGKLLNSTGGAVTVQGGYTATLDGSTQAVSNAGTVAINNQGTLSLLGNIANSGTIALQSTNQNTDLIIAGSKVTVSGTGMITMSDNPANRIYGAAAADVLDLVGGTITGAGQLGAGQLTLMDDGVISATGGNALILSLGSTATIQGGGQLLGIGSGGLLAENGTYAVSGLVEAESGSNVTFSNGATLANARVSVSNGHTYDVLGGGSFAAVAGSSGATLSIDAAAITSDNANIILSGAGASILFDGTAIENSLSGVSASGTLQILGGRSYATTLALTNLGQIDLGGGKLTAKSITTEAGSVISGFGAIGTALNSAGTLAAVGGALDLSANGNKIYGAVTGSGTLSLDHGNTTLESGATLGAATVTEINAAILNLTGPVTFGGTFDLVGGSSLTGGTFTNTGLFEQTGTGNAAPVSSAFSNAGSIFIGAGGGIAFTNGLTNTGTITDNGILKDSAALTGGTLNIGPSGATTVIASGSGAGNSTVSTLTMAGGGLNTTGTTLTVTGDYVNSAAGSGNSYKPFAGVAGTIDGQGTQLAVVGVDGTTITTVNGTLTISVAPGGTASFEIENTGASGSAALRGALETTVNGGHITGHALTGSGVTAQNYGPIAAGGASGVFTIAYSSGTLSGEAIHIASDFANVAGLTIDIVAASGGSAPAYAGRLTDADSFSTDWLVMHHG